MTTTDPERRLHEHRREARRTRRKTLLYGEMRRCGPETFTLLASELCKDLGEAYARERELIDQWRSRHPYGYNQQHGGAGGPDRSLRFRTRGELNNALRYYTAERHTAEALGA